jgi:hypothetical protein
MHRLRRGGGVGGPNPGRAAQLVGAGVVAAAALRTAVSAAVLTGAGRLVVSAVAVHYAAAVTLAAVAAFTAAAGLGYSWDAAAVIVGEALLQAVTLYYPLLATWAHPVAGTRAVRSCGLDRPHTAARPPSGGSRRGAPSCAQMEVEWEADQVAGPPGSRRRGCWGVTA